MLFHRVLREPLLHFLILGASVFALYSVLAPRADAPRERIVVSEGRIEQLAQVFARTWQRRPTPRELAGLVDAYVKEEVYYREAVKLGLDRDDTLVRRRMQQKMEFLTEPPDEALTPGPGDLEAFLERNRETFRAEPVAAFRQVLVAPGPDAEVDAVRARLASLAPGEAPTSLARATLLPAENPAAPLSRIARLFGEDFTTALANLPRDDWAGPVRSSYGLHLVHLDEYHEGRDPPLAEIRDRVLREWRARERERLRDAAYRDLLAAYEVVRPGDAQPPGAARAAQR